MEALRGTRGSPSVTVLFQWWLRRRGVQGEALERQSKRRHTAHGQCSGKNSPLTRPSGELGTLGMGFLSSRSQEPADLTG